MRYFGQSEIDALSPNALDAGTETHAGRPGPWKRTGVVDLALWTLLYMLGNAPDLDIAFKEEADRDAARDFMDMVDRMSNG